MKKVNFRESKELLEQLGGKCATVYSVDKAQVSAAVYASKGNIGGVYYDSIPSKMGVAGKLLYSELFDDSFNEKVFNIMQDIEVFLRWAETAHPEKYARKDEIIALGYYDLIKPYWDNITPLRDDFTGYLSKMIDKYHVEHLDDKVKINMDEWGDARKYAFITKEREVFGIKEVNNLVKLKVAYKHTQREYATRATMLADQDGLGGALTFALLYDFLYRDNADKENTSVGRITRGQKSEARFDENGDMIYTRTSSLFDLFSEGAINFMKWDGDITNLISAPQFAVIDLFLPEEKKLTVVEHIVNAINNRSVQRFEKRGGAMYYHSLPLTKESQFMSKREASRTMNLATSLIGVNEETKVAITKRLQNVKFKGHGVIDGSFDEYIGYPIGYQVYSKGDVSMLKLYIANVQGKYSQDSINAILARRAKAEDFKLRFSEEEASDFLFGDIEAPANDFFMEDDKEDFLFGDFANQSNDSEFFNEDTMVDMDFNFMAKEPEYVDFSIGSGYDY